MVRKKIKVLIVDDSAFIRLLISDILSEAGDMEVIGTAINGKGAVEKVNELGPDLVVLDINMPEYDGIYAIEHIMKENPCPILILSTIGNSDLEPIFDALQLGAVDYMNKPIRGGSKMREVNDQLLVKIRSVARAQPKVIEARNNDLKTSLHTFSEQGNYDIIVIGASTGGPSALEDIITALPANLNVPVLICQHMPSNFISPFVKRLNSISPLSIVLGQKTMVPRPGTIIVAPGNSNMIVEKRKAPASRRISFCTKVYKEYNNPSIDALMLSAAEVYGAKAIGVVLTGMGKDGVRGLKAIKDAGGYTIAQNKASSVIYGMPNAAVKNGAVIKSLDIKEIGGFLVNSL